MITALLPVVFFPKHYNIIISSIAYRPTSKNVHQMSAPTDIEHILVVEVSEHRITALLTSSIDRRNWNPPTTAPERVYRRRYAVYYR